MQPADTKLLEQLRTAFPLEPIGSAGAFDDAGTTYPDGESYARHLEGKTWAELDRAYMLTRADALGSIEDGVWSRSADTLMLLLKKPEAVKQTGSKLSRFEALVCALTPEQSEAIAAVLGRFATIDEGGSLGEAARIAFERDWEVSVKPA